MPSSALTTLAHWLAGEFSNASQAFEQPTWFVNLRLWHRPVPVELAQELGGSAAFFAEQASALSPDQPYRQRLFVLRESTLSDPPPPEWQSAASISPSGIQVQFFGFHTPNRWRGGGLDATRLAGLSRHDGMVLPGCGLDVTPQGDTFVGRMRSGDRCRFQYDGRVGQVILGFEVRANQFWSYDKGVDPDTERPLWGALMGPYRHEKVTDFSAQIAL